MRTTSKSILQTECKIVGKKNIYSVKKKLPYSVLYHTVYNSTENYVKRRFKKKL